MPVLSTFARLFWAELIFFCGWKEGGGGGGINGRVQQPCTQTVENLLHMNFISNWVKKKAFRGEPLLTHMHLEASTDKSIAAFHKQTSPMIKTQEEIIASTTDDWDKTVYGQSRTKPDSHQSFPVGSIHCRWLYADSLCGQNRHCWIWCSLLQPPLACLWVSASAERGSKRRAFHDLEDQQLPEQHTLVTIIGWLLCKSPPLKCETN